ERAGCWPSVARGCLLEAALQLVRQGADMRFLQQADVTAGHVPDLHTADRERGPYFLRLARLGAQQGQRRQLLGSEEDDPSRVGPRLILLEHAMMGHRKLIVAVRKVPQRGELPNELCYL